MSETLESEINYMEARIKSNEKMLLDSKVRLEALKQAKEATPIMLYKGLTQVDGNTENELFKITFSKDNYKYVLGGDGRSKPYDESRDGIVCTVQMKAWIKIEHEEIINRYIQDTHEVDYIEIETL